jgi:hypothetical protein
MRANTYSDKGYSLRVTLHLAFTFLHQIGGAAIKSEHAIQSEIMLAVSRHGCTIIRTNVGTVKTNDGRLFSAGPPPGWPDLSGFRHSDGRMILIECKNARGRLREDQKRFAAMIKRYPAVIYGVCRSAEDAVRLIEEAE